MMKPSLVPTPTTDKNGKQTTVHKLPVGDAKKSRTSSVAKPTTAVVAPKVDFAASDFLPLFQKLEQYTSEASALRNEVIVAGNEGENHRYSHHYDEIWAGHNINILDGSDGWSEEVINHNLAGIRQIREQVKRKELKAVDLLGTVQPETKQQAIEWCNHVEKRLVEALSTKGRSLELNAVAAKIRDMNFAAGRNLS